MDVDPRRVIILEKYKKNQNNFLNYLKIMHIFKKGLLKLSLKIYSSYAKSKNKIIQKMKLILRSSHITLKENEINRDILVLKK